MKATTATKGIVVGSRVKTWFFGDPNWEGEGVVEGINDSLSLVTVAFDDRLGRRRGNFSIQHVDLAE